MEKLALEYADAMTQTPVEVPEALFAKLGRNSRMRSWWNLRRQWPGRTTGRGLTMRSEWKPKVLQRGATARYQCARRVRLRFIPRVEALSLARNRLLVYSRGVTPKT